MRLRVEEKGRKKIVRQRGRLGRSVEACGLEEEEEEEGAEGGARVPKMAAGAV